MFHWQRVVSAEVSERRRAGCLWALFFWRGFYGFAIQLLTLHVVAGHVSMYSSETSKISGEARLTTTLGHSVNGDDILTGNVPWNGGWKMTMGLNEY